ncbi:hypothetical protein Vqi01_49360 [Micromonospora qiuiae]|uniref:Uncharacterized protein n=2 Tax=Micromonospora qiuiae TaxID=502268 RepID=A0ABQ4JJX7_9ACTN|nr:hypothetical protein Vqi01_49360 [Micromonospora qiuiae]
MPVAGVERGQHRLEAGLTGGLPCAEPEQRDPDVAGKKCHGVVSMVHTDLSTPDHRHHAGNQGSGPIAAVDPSRHGHAGPDTLESGTPARFAGQCGVWLTG